MSTYYKHTKKETADVPFTFRCEQCMKESGTLKATISGMEAEINSNYKTLDDKKQNKLNEMAHNNLVSAVKEAYSNATGKHIFVKAFKDECPHCHKPQTWGISGIQNDMFGTPIVCVILGIILGAGCYFFSGVENNLMIAVAAAGIYTTFTSLICMTVVGICQGMQPIVGYNYGAGNYHRLKRAYWLTVCCATIIVSVSATFGLSLPNLIGRAFTTDRGLIDVTSHGLSIALLCFFVVGFQIVSTTFFQSIGKVGQSIFLSLARQVLFLIPLLLLMTHLYQLDGVWMSFPISDALATLVTAIMIAYQFKKIDKMAYSDVNLNKIEKNQLK